MDLTRYKLRMIPSAQREAGMEPDDVVVILRQSRHGKVWVRCPFKPALGEFEVEKSNLIPIPPEPKTTGTPAPPSAGRSAIPIPGRPPDYYMTVARGIARMAAIDCATDPGKYMSSMGISYPPIPDILRCVPRLFGRYIEDKTNIEAIAYSFIYCRGKLAPISDDDVYTSEEFQGRVREILRYALDMALDDCIRGYVRGILPNE